MCIHCKCARVRDRCIAFNFQSKMTTTNQFQVVCEFGNRSFVLPAHIKIPNSSNHWSLFHLVRFGNHLIPVKCKRNQKYHHRHGNPYEKSLIAKSTSLQYADKIVCVTYLPKTIHMNGPAEFSWQTSWVQFMVQLHPPHNVLSCSNLTIIPELENILSRKKLGKNKCFNT